MQIEDLEIEGLVAATPRGDAIAPTDSGTGRFPVAVALATLAGLRDAVGRQAAAVNRAFEAYKPAALDTELREIVQNAEATIAKAKRLLAANR